MSLPPSALATPKSITRGTGLPSTVATRTLDGLRSRWTIPFWWACWTARQTSTKSRSRSRIGSRASSQYRVSGGPATSSMTKNGEPVSVTPPSRTLAMLGWSIRASACRSAPNRASRACESIPLLISLTATVRRTGSVCRAAQTSPMPPSPIRSRNVYRPAMTVPASASGVWVAVGTARTVAGGPGWSAVSWGTDGAGTPSGGGRWVRVGSSAGVIAVPSPGSPVGRVPGSGSWALLYPVPGPQRHRVRDGIIRDPRGRCRSRSEEQAVRCWQK